MISRLRTVGSVALMSSVTAILLAQAPVVPNLDVKMGLWEMTSSAQVGGEMPIDTSKMTPQQKTQMEAAMKSMMAPHTNVEKSCMTKDKFAKEGFMPQDSGMNCKQSVTTNTKTTLEGSVKCTGERAMTGQIHIDALSTTAIKGTIKASTTDQGKTMTVDMTLAGKWLGADCGDVK
jgi:hypothetical protein